ncbi:MAG: serine/threonine protein kinase [Gammaproteobacteria bacterium]|nr:serine/threonine protein kinase [Gammaproteobacteria bacterium]
MSVLLQIANGMQAAHEEDVVHRDLKPSNVLINKQGKVKVVDFGIASATAELDANLTKTGTIIGTPSYISPERAKGLNADHRADIYALGIISYYLFTGELPYKGEPMSLLFQHIEGKAKDIHHLNPKVSLKLSFLVKKMMAVDVNDRYQTMADVSSAIHRLQTV